METRLRLVAVALVVALVCAEPASGAATKHAYVSTFNDAGVSDGSFTGSTAAYPVVGGRVAERPDRVYPLETGGPMALDGQGNLYAAMFDCRVGVYAPDSTRRLRTLQFESPETCNDQPFNYLLIDALALDDSGHLFVGLEVVGEYASAHGARRTTNATRTSASFNVCGHYQQNCVAVYDASASGHVRPLQVLQPGQFTFDSGLAVDRQGDLYIAHGNSIDVVAQPATNPHVVRSIVAFTYKALWSPVMDDFGQLYALARRCTRTRCALRTVVFDAGAHGMVTPKRWFGIPYRENWTDMAITGGGLYVLTPAPTVEPFHKQSSGETVPLFYSSLVAETTNAAYLRFGP